MSETLPFLRFRLYLGHNVKGVPNQVDTSAAFRIVADAFPAGFTSYLARGHWQGGSELSTVFEIILRNETGAESYNVRRLAERLRNEFAQESVLMTAEPLPDVEFV